MDNELKKRIVDEVLARFADGAIARGGHRAAILSEIRFPGAMENLLNNLNLDFVEKELKPKRGRPKKNKQE